jgi:hypothetical protein
MMGTHSPYKGGRKLLDQLAFIEREAEQAADEAIAEGARDAAAYATGRLLNDDLKDDAHYETDTVGGFAAAVAVVPATAWLVDRVADRSAVHH